MSQKQQLALMTVLGVLLVFGCAGLANQSAIKYNNDMAGITKELESAHKDFFNNRDDRRVAVLSDVGHRINDPVNSNAPDRGVFF